MASKRNLKWANIIIVVEVDGTSRSRGPNFRRRSYLVVHCQER